MPDTRPDAPLYLREGSVPEAEGTASVDVTDLLARLAQQTEELAEARVRQKHAEDALEQKTREMNAERKALVEKRERLQFDCAELEADCDQAAAEARELEAGLARERDARRAAEADLKRMRERVASLQHQLQIARAQLQKGGAEVEPRPWWSRLGS